MRTNKHLVLLIAIAVLLFVLPTTVFAGTQVIQATTTTGQVHQFEFITPQGDPGFDRCPAQFPNNQISFNNFPAGWDVFGWVTISSINGSYSNSIQITSINQFPLTIDYGPISNYAVFKNPDTAQFLREAHVGMSIGVVDGNNELVDLVLMSDSDPVNNPAPGSTLDALGPGNDWDVFCFEEPPEGDEGCTPGYWKNHTDSWLPTGYSPGQSVVSVFADAGAYPQGAASLLEALQFGGGPRVEGGVKILLRAAVASLLNASHPGVDFARSAADVIADVNAALATGNRHTMLALATALDNDNNDGCGLN